MRKVIFFAVQTANIRDSQAFQKTTTKSFTFPRGRCFTCSPVSRVRSSKLQHSAVSTVGSEKKIPSFVQDVMKPYAMKLHTRDQAREGELPAQTPFTAWQPTRQNYLQFLVDALVVYQAFEDIIQRYPALEAFRNTGLERSEPLQQDIAWLLQYDHTLVRYEAGPLAKAYATFLYEKAEESIPKFICHYYNHYFAHSAGGRMIGKRIIDALLEGKALKFYEWKSDIKQLIDSTKHKIDELAVHWSEKERQDCLEETMACFHYGSDMLNAIKPPEVHNLY
eukprot:scaffold537_cov180-Ochromonas_danica.AAC.30